MKIDIYYFVWSLLHLVAAGDKRKSLHHHLILGLEDSEVLAAASHDQPVPAQDPVTLKPAGDGETPAVAATNNGDEQLSPHVAVSLVNSSNESCSHRDR